MTMGKLRWAIPEGFLPDKGPHADDRELASHEAACILNTNDRDARLVLTLYFSDREPVAPYHITVPARRALPLRFDDLRDPEPIPRTTDYASLFESALPVVIQHTRLDARPGQRALITTLAHGCD